jgi:polar amino acid transport system permease protein
VGYEFDFTTIAANAGLIAKGVGVTLLLTALTAVMGTAVSIAGAIAATWGGKMLRKAITIYVELIRNTPFIVQLFFIFFGLPSLGLRLPAIAAALIAMVINLSAYGIEIMRAGLQSVDRGQTEGGFALGLGPVVVLRLILLPQAIATVYPALVGQAIIMMLESAVVSQIAVTDLTHVADYIQSRTYRAFETYAVAALIYLVLAMTLRRILSEVGRRYFAPGEQR